MNREIKKKIQIRLIEMDLTQAEIARRLNVSDPMISLVISRQRKSRDVQISIARILELDPKELWQE